MHLEGQQVRAPGGPAGACTWRASRCAHLEVQQVHAHAGPLAGTVTRVFHRDSATGVVYMSPPHRERNRWRVEQAYMDLRIFFTFLGKVIL